MQTRLLELEVQLQAWSIRFEECSMPLVFQSPPNLLSSEYSSHVPSPAAPSNRTALHLKANAPENAVFEEYHLWLLDTYDEVTGIPQDHPDEELCIIRERLMIVLTNALKELEKMKEVEWVRQRDHQKGAREYAAAGVPIFDTASITSPPDVTQYPFYTICHLLVAVLNIICNVSIHRCNDFIIPMLKIILREHQHEYGEPDEVTDAADGIPGSIQTVTSRLGIEPSLQVLTCCRSCFSCYEDNDTPTTCTHRRAPDLPACGHPLFTERRRKGNIVLEPARQLHIQKFRHWLGQFLCRPGMEDILDRDVYATGACEGELLDIWDGDVLRKFCGPDGAKFVPEQASRALKLVFAICMDNFNPFFNKAGGKSYSAGVISLICLNLPPGMRHLLENMFVFCVFPGPHEPELEHINNVLRLLVDEFLVFWKPGVYYSSTPKYPEGRLVNGAIVPLLADLLGARKMSGIGRWCTQCPLEARDIDNLAEDTWPARHTKEEHRKIAEEWKSLGSKERNTHFKKHGIRWSELLRLSYWDPVTFTIVEFSHNLLGNNAQHHLRTVFGMNINLQDGLGDKPTLPPKKAKEIDPVLVNNAWEKVLHGRDKDLEGLPAYLLRECCGLAGAATGGRHRILLARLQQWRQDHLTIDPNNTAQPSRKAKTKEAPTDADIHHGEAVLARARSKKTMLSVKKGVIQKMVIDRIPSLTQSPQARYSSAVPSYGEQSNPQLSLSTIHSSKKSELIDMLFELECKEDRIVEQYHNTAVLGSQTLKTIREDLQKMSLPSWIGRVPSDLGSARHGTLSHDALRTVATVVLPSSLTRLWGLKPAGSRERRILENYLDMSTSIILALLRASSIAVADESHRLWLRYLRGLQDLYPYLGRIPNQHITLHLATNIKNFGPAPGQRTNVCERINFLLQKTPTNSKPGEMEMTMLKRFCMAQNLRLLVRSLPERLQVVTQYFTKAFDSDGRGTLQEEIGDCLDVEATFPNTTKLTVLSDDLYRMLCRRRPGLCLARNALMQSHIDYGRKRFSTFRHSASDSLVVFTTDGTWMGGRISDIIVQTNDTNSETEYEITIVVQKFSTLDRVDEPHDPYLAQNRATGLGCLCYSLPKDTVLIGLENLVCHSMCHPNHFAGVSKDSMHVMPLRRR